MRTLSLVATALLLAAANTNGATFTVTRADDPSGGICNAGDCSLRNAILSANTAAGPDTIAFAVPAAPSGVATIIPTAALPAITGDDTTIDGFSQAGSAPGAGHPAQFTATIRLAINGTAVSAAGLVFAGNRAVVRGISIYGFGDAQLDLAGANHHVRGSLIGIAPDLTMPRTMPPLGVRIRGGTAAIGNVVGGSQSDNDRNLIAGHATAVLIDQAGAGANFTEENRVSGNLINVAPDGDSALPGGHGVRLRAARNARVGMSSSTPFVDANSIGGVGEIDRIGVVIDGGSRLFVEGNWIAGTSLGAAHPLGTGVLVANGASEVFVQFNLIRAVHGSGIVVIDGTAAPGSTGALLEKNSVLSTGGPAIDLRGDGATANDAGDLDVGPNRLTNVPVITDARIVGNSYVIDATLDAEPNTNYAIEPLLMNRPGSGIGGGTPQAKTLDPNSPGAVATVPAAGASGQTDANGRLSVGLTVARTFVAPGYSLGLTASRFVNFGGGNVTSEVTTAANFVQVFPGATILALDRNLEHLSLDRASIQGVLVKVQRRGSAQGAASVVIRKRGPNGPLLTNPQIPLDGLTLTWADGDTSERFISLRYDGGQISPGGQAVAGVDLANPVGATIGVAQLYNMVILPTLEFYAFADQLFGARGGNFEDASAP